MSQLSSNSKSFGARQLWRAKGRVAGIFLGAAVALINTVQMRAADAQGINEVTSLTADIARLKQELAEKEKTFATLVNGKLTERSAIQTTVASGIFSRGSGKGLPAPTSSLTKDNALKAAYGSNLFVKGSVIKSVAATGSMQPVLSEHSYLLMEPASFDDLRVGDIVTYIHPAINQPVTHRLIAKRAEGFVAKGDHNTDADNVWVTKSNYQMRVYGIIYSGDPTSS